MENQTLHILVFNTEGGEIHNHITVETNKAEIFTDLVRLEFDDDDILDDETEIEKIDDVLHNRKYLLCKSVKDMENIDFLIEDRNGGKDGNLQDTFIEVLEKSFLTMHELITSL